MHDDLDLDEIEALGIDDGSYDRQNRSSYQASFGSSINFDELNEEQREAYELGYNIGAEDYDLSSDDDDDDDDDDW